MIIVNNINISNDGNNLNINVSVGTGYIVTSIKLWNENTYKDYSLAKDLSFKLEQVNNRELFNVDPTEIGLTNFSGIYFIEFETNQPNDIECSTCPNPLLAVITNLNQYYKCMSELILQADICNANLFSREVCDDNSINKALSVNLFIDAINQSLEIGQFIEAISLLKNLKKLCNKCKSCTTIKQDTSNCTSCNQYIYA